MQWVDGVSLYDQARLRPPQPPEVRRWLLQLAEALAALHAQGAVHLQSDEETVKHGR
jgi:eukaryotic-like serine/threonine-protein kinase